MHIEEGYYTVLLTLAQPRGPMKTLYWGADTLEEVTTFIRLLEEGKLSALKAAAYSAAFRTDLGKTFTNMELSSCAEQVKDSLELCVDCPIVEWVFRGKAD